MYYKDSIYGNICVVECEGQYIYFLDGISQMIIPIPDIVFVEEFVHIPCLAHPSPKKLLIQSGVADSNRAAKYSSGAESYPEITKKAILEMHRQVCVAKPAKDGIMYRGLMIRHLVMPNNAGGSEKVMEWIAENLSRDTYINIMSQYNPLYKAYYYPEISRRIIQEEYLKVVNRTKELGLTNLDIQGYWWLGM